MYTHTYIYVTPTHTYTYTHIHTYTDKQTHMCFVKKDLDVYVKRFLKQKETSERERDF